MLLPLATLAEEKISLLHCIWTSAAKSEILETAQTSQAQLRGDICSPHPQQTTGYPSILLPGDERCTFAGTD